MPIVAMAVAMTASRGDQWNLRSIKMLLANVRGRSQLREQRILEDFSRVINALGGWRYPIQSTQQKPTANKTIATKRAHRRRSRRLPYRFRRVRSFCLAALGRPVVLRWRQNLIFKDSFKIYISTAVGTLTVLRSHATATRAIALGWG